MRLLESLSPFLNLPAMASETLFRIVSDPSLLSISFLAALTIHISVLASLTPFPSKPSVENLSPTHPEQAARFPPCIVALIPCLAAAMLVTMFVFMSTIGPLLLLLAAAVTLPACTRLASLFLGTGRFSSVATTVFGVTVAAAWMLTGHWALNDVIGVSFCVMVASFVKIPSLKMLTLLLLGLLVYDVLFVFVSPLLFGGRNVMVDVATALPRNPLDLVVTALGFPRFAVANISFPGKFLVPVDWGQGEEFVILGLGDVVVPTCLFAFLRRFDLAEEGGKSWYYPIGLPAYVVALLFSFFMNLSTGLAQPALLYIVPVLLLVTFGLALKRGELATLWKGSPGSGVVVFEERWNAEQTPLFHAEPRSVSNVGSAV